VSEPVPGLEIHVLENASRAGRDRFEVWLDPTEVGPTDGLCLGMGGTREDAIESAITDLADTIVELRAMAGKG
jgi:hypothetical protein